MRESKSDFVLPRKTNASFEPSFYKVSETATTAYGGPAMTGQIRQAVASDDDIALGQVSPGLIMITTTFIGYKVSGLLGALIATIGVFSSSFFILILLVLHYHRLRQMKIVETVEQGILGSFVGMLGLVLYNFGSAAFVDTPSIIFAIAAFIALRKKIVLAYILFSGAILSILFFGLLN